MEFQKCIEARRSRRKFLDKEVSRDLLAKILATANRCPSYMNTQPWEVFVVAGEKKNVLAQKLYEQGRAGVTPNPDIPYPQSWPQALSDRAMGNRMRRFDALGVDVNDNATIRESTLQNYLFFNAPAAFIIGMDKSLTRWSVFDLGIFTQSILLALEDEGLGGVPQAFAVGFPEIIRQELGLTDQTMIVLAISLGYPDPESPVNQYRSTRKEPDEFIKWYGV